MREEHKLKISLSQKARLSKPGMTTHNAKKVYVKFADGNEMTFISVRKLAEYLHLDPASICRYLNGTRKPRGKRGIVEIKFVE